MADTCLPLSACSFFKQHDEFDDALAGNDEKYDEMTAENEGMKGLRWSEETAKVRRCL